MTFSHIVYDFVTTFSQLVQNMIFHNLIMNFSWLVHDFFMTFSCLFHNLLITCSQLFCNLFMIFLWLFHDLLLAHDLFLTWSWIVYYFPKLVHSLDTNNSIKLLQLHNFNWLALGEQLHLKYLLPQLSYFTLINFHQIYQTKSSNQNLQNQIYQANCLKCKELKTLNQIKHTKPNVFNQIYKSSSTEPILLNQT